jgi:lysophospholipase L1-like esterase
MNPLGLMFLDGTALFAGLAVVLTAGVLFVRSGTGLLRPILTVLTLAGLAAVLLSAVPLPSWLYALWVLPAGAVLVLGNLSGAAPALRFRVVAVLLVASTAVVLVELPHLRSPRIRVAVEQPLYIVGDSISAGIGSGERCWPEVLAAATALRVVNLAEPGATIQSALAQVPRIAESNAVVLLEIGGNDLLDRKGAATFESHLEELVSVLRANGHAVAMFELPRFPFQNAFGRAQRAVAKRHAIALIPRRHFARVLGMENGTLDGLHLTQKGHDEMARRVAALLWIKNHPASP